MNRANLNIIPLSAIFTSVAFCASFNDLQAQDYVIKPMSRIQTPICTDNIGHKVIFMGTTKSELRRKGIGLAYASRNARWPYVKYDQETLASTSKIFQNHVLTHECAHHILGHFDEPPPTTLEDENRQEFEADCYAMQVLGYGRNEVDIIIQTMDRLYPFDPQKSINVTVPDMRPSLNSCLAKLGR